MSTHPYYCQYMCIDPPPPTPHPRPPPPLVYIYRSLCMSTHPYYCQYMCIDPPPTPAPAPSCIHISVTVYVHTSILLSMYVYRPSTPSTPTLLYSLGHKTEAISMDHLMRWASWCWLVGSVWVLGDELRKDCREDGRLSDEECCLLIVCPGVLVRGKVVQE